MTIYAHIRNGIVLELIPPREDGVSVDQAYTAELVAAFVPLTEDMSGEVQVGWEYVDGAFRSPEEQPPPQMPVPQKISRKQFILILKRAGKITAGDAMAWAQSAAVPAAFDPVLADMPADDADDARITLLTMVDVERAHPLIAAAIAAGMATADEADNLFRAGALIT